MDPVTHTLTGITLSNLTTKRAAFFWILVISSVLPDIDYVTRMWGLDIFLRYHRGITHGILAMIAGPLFISAIFRIIYGSGFFSYFALSLIGYGIHLTMDLTNQYGTRILSPFDWDQYSLGLTFIIDPYVSLALLAAVITTKVFRMKRFAISLVAILFIVGYVGSKAILKTTAASFLKERVEHRQVHLAPLPNDFLRWWYVAENLDDIQIGLVDLFTKKVYVHDDLIYSDYDPLIRLSKEDRAIENFLYFARFPYPSVYSKDRYTLVEWRELSYAYIPGDHFVARVIFDENGNKVSSSFRF
jgi:inner membrane protein